MNCDQARERFLAALAGESPGPGDAPLSRHLAECAACQATSREFTALWSNLGALPEIAPPPGARARFDAALAAIERDTAPARYRPAQAGAAGWRAWLGSVLGARPLPLAGALALATLAFVFGHVVAMRGSQMAALQRDLQATRSMVALSLLQQRSAVDRLRGVGFSARIEVPDASLLDVLFETLASDPNVDVRLAAVEALAGVQDGSDVAQRLLAQLPQQSSPMVQIAIIDAVVFQRDPRAQDALRAIAADSLADATVRQRARWGDRQLTL